MTELRLQRLSRPGPILATIYEDLLVPSFIADELGPLDQLADGLTGGSVAVSALVEGEFPVGVAVGEWSAASQVLLLAYLAVRPGRRSAGLGSRLLDEVTGAWQERFQPQLALAEVEHPAAHTADPARGDPAARLRFYARHGARALDLPFFQPALRPGAHRVYGLLLTVLAHAGSAAGAGPGTIRPEPIRAFLTEYLTETEGEVGTDPDTTALWQAMDRPGGIPTMSLDDPDRLLPLLGGVT